jgi:hypothetical protein
VSVTNLSEQEIQRRIQLGFITPSLGGHASSANSMAVSAAAVAVSDQVLPQSSSEDWQDITTDEEIMQEEDIVEAIVAANVPDDYVDDNDDATETEGAMDDIQHTHNDRKNPYLLDTNRRSSIDLGHLSFNRHDEALLLSSSSSSSMNEVTSTTNGGQLSGLGMDSMNQYQSNKRLRYRQPSVASISEEEQLPISATSNNSNNNKDDDDDEVATVDGNDDDIMEDI